MTENKRIPVIPSTLEETTVLCTGTHSISLYNKGHYGTPEKNGVRLDGFETLHLLELERITVESATVETSPQGLSKYFAEIIDDFMLRYFVYKDLRNRGYVTNLGEGSSFFFRLYARDTKPKKSSAKYYVTALQEGGSIPLLEMNDLIEIASKSKKILLLGMVDASGDVSYLKVTQLVPDDISEERADSDLKSWDWETAIGEFSNTEKTL